MDGSDVSTLIADRNLPTAPCTTSGQGIDRWLDKSTRQNHATAYSPATKPSKYTVGWQNGLSAVWMDGADYFDFVDIKPLTGTRGVTFLCVMDLKNTTAHNAHPLTFYGAGNTVRFSNGAYFAECIGVSPLVTGTGLPVALPLLYGVVGDPTTGVTRIFTNSLTNLKGTGTYSSALTNGQFVTMTLGRGGGNIYFKGHIMEMLMWDCCLTDSVLNAETGRRPTNGRAPGRDLPAENEVHRGRPHTASTGVGASRRRTEKKRRSFFCWVLIARGAATFCGASFARPSGRRRRKPRRRW
jgi:hypothetical protein